MAARLNVDVERRAARPITSFIESNSFSMRVTWASVQPTPNHLIIAHYNGSNHGIWTSRSARL
jgi:hypothetical protein